MRKRVLIGAVLGVVLFCIVGGGTVFAGDSKITVAATWLQVTIAGEADVSITDVTNPDKAEYFLTMRVTSVKGEESVVQVKTMVGFTTLVFVRRKLADGKFEPYEFGNGRPFSTLVLRMFFKPDEINEIIAVAAKALGRDFCYRN